MPVVSVIMAAFNSEDCVAQALDSILAQTFSDFELLVVDDGSTDSTPEILRGYQDERLRVVSQTNAGLTAALNGALRLARGEFIARMDDDDISLPDRLERQVEYLRGHAEVGLLGTGFYEMDRSGLVIGQRRYPRTDAELRKALISYNPFCHGSVMIRRRVLDEVGLYDPAFTRAQDYELWFRVASRSRLANLAAPLLRRRYDPSMASVAAEREQLYWAIKARLSAISHGYYPRWRYLNLIRPGLALILPDGLRWFFRRHFLGSRNIARSLGDD